MNSSSVELRRCAFCRIARGEDDSVEVVCADQRWIAFFPRNPATPGHTLVIPRAHVADLWQIEPAQGSDLMAAVIEVGRAIDSALEPEGMNLITSAGEAAEQTVFHLHLHLVPRWQQDGFSRIWPRKTGLYGTAELRDAANRIRQACTDAR
jgi:histidine triad (HIT) family protein